ncbi:MAG TPA: tRNA pseudouridine(38-40) synthase TruA [Opitutaceae bacterium]|nr:tRNA pseudouridine(38-40) synthase TruA [Opitutaceae bacterium]
MKRVGARGSPRKGHSGSTCTRWKCTCAYDGSEFSGWQSQPRGSAIQDVLEARLAGVLGFHARIHASGRTDAGAHASGQVFHFDAAWPHGPDKLAAALRNGLHRAIQIKSIRAAAPGFHARFSATGKVYSYHIHLGDADPFTRPFCWAILRPLDLGAMRASAAALEGRHDFRAFSALNGAEAGDEADAIRDLRRFEVFARGRSVRVVAEADGFLYKMVRRLVGALVASGEGKITPDEIRALLASGTRTARIVTAPAQGLFLRRVLYR